MNAIDAVKVELTVVIGQSTVPIHQLLRMGRGAVVELDAHMNDEVQIFANEEPIAKGEIILQGDRIAVSITDTIKGKLE